MDRYLKETFKVEQETMYRSSKLQNIEKMQWLRNTSSPDFGKTIGVSKRIYFDTSIKKVDADLLTANIEACSESDKYYVTDKCKNLSIDLAKSDENTQKEDTDIITLISNTNKVIDQKKDKELLSIVESIVTAQVEAEFSTDKKQTDLPNMSQNNESVTKSQIPNQELTSIKQSDGNNNSTSITPCTTLSIKEDNGQKTSCKITEAENAKPSMEAKNKDVQKQSDSVPKIKIKNKNNALSSKMREKPSFSGTNFKKTIVNTAKTPPDRSKTTKSHDCIRTHSVKYEKETKNSTPKSNTGKRNCEMESNKTTDSASQSKPINKDKVVPRYYRADSKQFVPKLRNQDSLKKSALTIKQVADRNKSEITTQKEEATQSKLCDLSSNGSATKEEKIIDEKPYKNRTATGEDKVRRSTTFVLQYRNSSYSRVSQSKGVPRNTDERISQSKNVPRNTDDAMSYRRSTLPYTSNNRRTDRFNSGNTQCRAIVKKGYINEQYKSRIEEHRNANNIENCEKQRDETHHDDQNQSNQIKLELKTSEANGHEVDVPNGNVEPVRTKTDLKKDENSDNVDNENTEQKQNVESVTTSEQREKVVDISKVDTTQQSIQVTNKTKSERTNLSKHSVNSHSNKCTVESQGTVQNEQLSKVENVEYTKNIPQFVSKQIIWNNQTFDSTVQRNIAMNVQQSVQNMQYSLQQTQERNEIKPCQPYVPSWEPSYDKDQQFSNNAIQYSQVSNAYDTTQYEYNVQPALCDDSAINASSLIPMIGVNMENPNVLYRYEPNLQQRLITTTPNFSGLSSEMDEARWSPSVHNRHLYAHVDQSYNSAQHTYDLPNQQSHTSTPELSMHVYNAGLNEMYNAQATNCTPHPIVYAPSSCMQPWNPQLQYSIPVFYASPCASYTMVPATANQLDNFENIGPVHDHQFKYIPYSRTNDYSRDAHDNDMHMSNCAAQIRNTADSIKSNQYYKQYHDNCQFVHDVPQYATPNSKSQDTSCMAATGATHHCNAYRSINQRYHKQNYAMMSANLKKQTQDLSCDDENSEDIPPIISPKEFVTRREFSPRACNQGFKNSNVGYHMSQLQKYNGGLRRNSSCHHVSKQYTSSVSIGRGKNNKKV